MERPYVNYPLDFIIAKEYKKKLLETVEGEYDRATVKIKYLSIEMKSVSVSIRLTTSGGGT